MSNHSRDVVLDVCSHSVGERRWELSTSCAVLLDNVSRHSAGITCGLQRESRRGSSSTLGNAYTGHSVTGEGLDGLQRRSSGKEQRTCAQEPAARAPSRGPSAQRQMVRTAPTQQQPAQTARIWPQLPPELAERVTSFLPPNEVACNVRLVNKATAALFRGPPYSAVRLSLPVPHHAFKRHWGRNGVFRCMTLAQRRQLLSLTARSGSLANLKYAVKVAGCLPDSQVINAAAAAGQAACCRWIQRRYICLFKDALAAAAAAGQQAMCEWGLENAWPWRSGAVYEALRGGHLELADWLLSKRIRREMDTQLFPSIRTDEPITNGLLLAAVAEGCDLQTLQERYHTWPLEQEQAAGQVQHLPLLMLPQQQQQMLLERNPRAIILAAAACSPTPDWQAKVLWLEGLGYPQTPLMCRRVAAACLDALQRLTWLRARGCPVDGRVAEAAVQAGRQDVLAALLAEGIRPDVGCVEEAGHGGHLGVITLLHSQGLRVFQGDPQGMLCIAAQGGHLPLVAWLVQTFGTAGDEGEEEPAVSLSTWVFDSAARSGNLELL
ncbi:hypothetical protein Agub_g3406, partial [Astrephomene gubernaculifera]